MLIALGLPGFAADAPSAGSPMAGAQRFFTIVVVDEETGRGVPLVELKTVSEAAWWTDSAGVIAMDEPGFAGAEVYFHVASHGYRLAADGFGYRGVKLRPVPGGGATIKLRRENIAERLYRVTGEGIYRDSVLAGRAVPLRRPLLNAQVTGQDTVIATPYRGKIHWFWGDTNRAGYPLGNFAVSGATSDWPGRGGLPAERGVDLDYFVDEEGFSRPMCPNFGPGLHWIESVMTAPDETGTERLVARVSSQRDLGAAYQWHLAVFNDEKRLFEPKVRWDIRSIHDSSHPFRATVEGADYLYLYPNYRVRRDLASLADLARYEALTCIAGDGKVRGAETVLRRDENGRLRYAWVGGADRLDTGRMEELESAGKMVASERWLQLHDYTSGRPVNARRGSVAWNEYRRRWVMLISAEPGEIWFAEGDTPAGPWVYARRVVAHTDYNFYNPTQHAFLDEDGGRRVYFEGTYTAAFSAARSRTPRYDYNQIMYRLSLDDPRLSLPAPVYRVRMPNDAPRYLPREEIVRQEAWGAIEDIAFFAFPPERAPGELVPVFAGIQEGRWFLQAGSAPPAGDGPSLNAPLFFALPAVPSEPPLRAVAGTWRVKARMADTAGISFELRLAQRGRTVDVIGRDPAESGRGIFENGLLQLEYTTEEKTYQLAAEISARALEGTWRRADRDEQGTWSATRIEDEAGEHRSPAIVPLYEYRWPDGRRIYATGEDRAVRDAVRAPQPVCRVWRNPMKVLVLDPEPRPVAPGSK